jgi:hypothetical protein
MNGVPGAAYMSLTRAPPVGVDVTRFQIPPTADAVGRVGVGDGAVVRTGIDEVVRDAAGPGLVVGDAVGDGEGVPTSRGGPRSTAATTATRPTSASARTSGPWRMSRP